MAITAAWMKNDQRQVAIVHTQPNPVPHNMLAQPQHPKICIRKLDTGRVSARPNKAPTGCATSHSSEALFGGQLLGRQIWYNTRISTRTNGRLHTMQQKLLQILEPSKCEVLMSSSSERVTCLVYQAQKWFKRNASKGVRSRGAPRKKAQCCWKKAMRSGNRLLLMPQR
jgi:hypothetical protein